MMNADAAPRDFRPRDYPVGPLGRGLLVLIGLALAAGFGLAWTVSPDSRGYGTHQQFGLPPCSLYVLFGIPCPSCGSTTAFAHYVRGEWLAAARSNMAAFLLALLCTLLIPWSGYSAWRGRLWRISDPAWSIALALVGLATTSLLHWGVRCVAARMT